MFILDCIVKTSLVLALGLSVLPLLRKKSAAFRHWVLSAVLLSAALIPAFSRALPSWRPAPASNETVGAVYDRALFQGSGQAFIPAEVIAPIALAIWIAGTVVALCGLLTGWIRLLRITRASLPLESEPWTRQASTIALAYRIRGPIELLLSRNASMLVTWGIARPKVILPAGASDWSEDRLVVVLRHELAHIRRRDLIVQMLGQALRLIYWFNPLVWVACRRLSLESECACDDVVLASGVDPHDYAGHLFEIARLLQQPGRVFSSALAMASPSTMERRFTAMLDPILNRRPLSRAAMAAIAIAVLAVVAPLAMLSAHEPVSAASPSPIVEQSIAREQTAPAPAVNPSTTPAEQPSQRDAERQVRERSRAEIESAIQETQKELELEKVRRESELREALRDIEESKQREVRTRSAEALKQMEKELQDGRLQRLQRELENVRPDIQRTDEFLLQQLRKQEGAVQRDVEIRQMQLELKQMLEEVRAMLESLRREKN